MFLKIQCCILSPPDLRLYDRQGQHALDKRIGGRGREGAPHLARTQLVYLLSLSLTWFSRIHLVPYGPTWSHLASLGLTWSHVNLKSTPPEKNMPAHGVGRGGARRNPTWSHSAALGLTWSHLILKSTPPEENMPAHGVGCGGACRNTKEITATMRNAFLE
jgi:hypothetical protein